MPCTADSVPWAESAVSRRLLTSDLMSGSTSRVKLSRPRQRLVERLQRMPELRSGGRAIEILQHAAHALQDLRQIARGGGGKLELSANLLDVRGRRIRAPYRAR